MRRTSSAFSFSAPWAAALLRAILLVPALQVASVAHADTTLTFGAYTSDKPTSMVAQLRPTLDLLAADLTRRLGEPVDIQMQIVGTYQDGVDLVVTGKADFVRLGPASYVVAKARNPDIDILVMEQSGGEKVFYGVICVRQDSEITSIRELKGKSFAFGSSKSTIGRYLAQLHLMRAGVLAGDLARFEYLGRHDKVGTAVSAGLFDAGALEETMFNALVEDGHPLRAIARFPNATKPWVARADMDPRVKQALRESLLALEDAEALAALRFDGFLPGTDAEFGDIRRAMTENPNFFVGYNG